MEEVTKAYLDLYGKKEKDEEDTNTAGDWIAKLFKPTFAFTVQDILDGKAEDVEIKSKIKRVSPLDPEGIQQVYQRVLMMHHMEEELHKQKLEQISKSQGTGRSIDYKEFVPEEEKKEFEAEDLEKSVIWDTEELSVLRKVFKSAKGQISDLKVKLRETEERNKYLEKTVKEQEHQLETTCIKKNEAKKANQRLKIHCDNLQEQLNHTSAKLDTVTDMWKDIDQEKSKMMKDMHETRVNHEKEGLLRQDLELKLDSVIRDSQRAIDIAVQNIEVQYQKQILDLERELNKVSQEFTKEKQTYGVTSKALNQIRHHFASLPLNDIMPPNAVVENEVSLVDHIS